MGLVSRAGVGRSKPSRCPKIEPTSRQQNCRRQGTTSHNAAAPSPDWPAADTSTYAFSARPSFSCTHATRTVFRPITRQFDRGPNCFLVVANRGHRCFSGRRHGRIPVEIAGPSQRGLLLQDSPDSDRSNWSVDCSWSVGALGLTARYCVAPYDVLWLMPHSDIVGPSVASQPIKCVWHPAPQLTSPAVLCPWLRMCQELGGTPVETSTPSSSYAPGSSLPPRWANVNWLFCDRCGGSDPRGLGGPSNWIQSLARRQFCKLVGWSSFHSTAREMST